VANEMGRTKSKNMEKIREKILSVLEYPKSASEIACDLAHDNEFISLLAPIKSNGNLIGKVENRVRYYLIFMRKKKMVSEINVKEKRVFMTNMIKYKTNQTYDSNV